MKRWLVVCYCGGQVTTPLLILSRTYLKRQQTLLAYGIYSSIIHVKGGGLEIFVHLKKSTCNLIYTLKIYVIKQTFS